MCVTNNQQRIYTEYFKISTYFESIYAGENKAKSSHKHNVLYIETL